MPALFRTVFVWKRSLASTPAFSTAISSPSRRRDRVTRAPRASAHRLRQREAREHPGDHPCRHYIDERDQSNASIKAPRAHAARGSCRCGYRISSAYAPRRAHPAIRQWPLVVAPSRQAGARRRGSDRPRGNDPGRCPGSPDSDHAEADLLGVPVRIVVGPKGMASGIVEATERASSQKREVSIGSDLVQALADWV